MYATVPIERGHNVHACILSFPVHSAEVYVETHSSGYPGHYIGLIDRRFGFVPDDSSVVLHDDVVEGVQHLSRQLLGDLV